MTATNKVNRFEIDDLLRRGFRAYHSGLSTDKDRAHFSKILYYRYFLDNFFIGNAVFVKNRKHD